MNKRGWSDKQVEECIRKLPKVTDDRSPEYIYMNVSRSMSKTRKKPWVMPGLAAAAAAFLIFLLVSPDFTQKAPDKEIALEQNNHEKGSGADSDVSGNPNQNIALKTGSPETSEATALYAEDIGDRQPVTLWVPESQANFLVPVSVSVEGKSGGNWLDSFKTAMSEIKEPEWGLSEYYPMAANLSLEDENTLVVDLLGGHKYGMSSAEETLFQDSLIENAASNSAVTEIKFTTEGQKGITLGNTGEISTLKVEKKKNRAYFFSTQQGRELPYLVPSRDEFPTFEAALEAMKSGTDAGLEASLSPTVAFEKVEAKDKTVYLHLADGSIIENNESMVLSLEALLMTAKEFGFDKVKIENSPINKLGKFDLNLEIAVPVGPNYMPVE